MKKHWYVVANRKRAEIFINKELRDGGNQLTLIKALENPLGDAKRRDLIRHEAGKSHKPIGRGAVHFAEVKRKDPLEVVAGQFSKKISSYLRDQQLKNNFTGLTIVAEPHFLGILRASMPSELTAAVSKWLRKDLVKTPPAKLPGFLLPKKVKSQIPLRP